MKDGFSVLTVISIVIVFFMLFAGGCQEQQVLPAASEEPVISAEDKPDSDVSKLPGRIKFKNPVHNFGMVGPGTGSICEFKFKNVGEGTLRIKRVQTTCGCTVPKLKKKVYAPGESGTIRVTYKAGKRPGRVSKNLYVHNNDEKSPKVKLTIKANVIIKIDFKPEKLNLSLREDNAGCPEITLRSVDNVPFSIKKFRSTSDIITADYNSTEEATEFVLKPKVDMDKLREIMKGRIDVILTHPECDGIVIPFKADPALHASPPSLILLNAEPNEPMTREVWILSNYDEDFEITSTSSAKGLIKVVDKEKHDNSYKLTLQILPPASGAKKVFSDEFRIDTGTEKLKVYCRGFYSQRKKQ